MPFICYKEESGDVVDAIGDTLEQVERYFHILRAEKHLSAINDAIDGISSDVGSKAASIVGDIRQEAARMRRRLSREGFSERRGARCKYEEASWKPIEASFECWPASPSSVQGAAEDEQDASRCGASFECDRKYQ